MMKSFKMFIHLSLAGLALAMAEPTFASAQDDLKNLLNQIQSLQADFSQSMYDSHAQLLKQYQGKMALLRPNRFRWDIQTPIQQLTIADGQRLWVYDSSLKQVMVQPLKKGKTITPAMLLSGTAKGLLNDFFIAKVGEWFILKPKAGEMVKKIGLKFSGNKLVEMQITDELEQTNVIDFSHVQLNSSLPASLFQFSVPAGVDVVHMA